MGSPAKLARQVASASSAYSAVLARRIDYTESLSSFWILPDRPTPFEPGQYMTIGVELDGVLVQRPYSVANAPHEVGEGYEVYVRRVEGGLFTPLLFDLQVGQSMSLKGPKGKFTLHPSEADTQLYISTGTGIAPFVSMMKSLLIEGRPRRTVLIQGVSYPCDLSHRDLLQGWSESGLYPLIYEPTVSRHAEAKSRGWAGRAGRTEAVLGDILREHAIAPESTIAYLCGNPGMVREAEAVLSKHGFGQSRVKKELYWTKTRAR